MNNYNPIELKINTCPYCKSLSKLEESQIRRKYFDTNLKSIYCVRCTKCQLRTKRFYNKEYVIRIWNAHSNGTIESMKSTNKFDIYGPLLFLCAFFILYLSIGYSGIQAFVNRDREGVLYWGICLLFLSMLSHYLISAAIHVIKTERSKTDLIKSCVIKSETRENE